LSAKRTLGCVLPWPGVKSFVATSAAAAVALAAVLALSAPAGAAPAGPFREVAVVKGARYVKSDGMRFAWATNSWGEVYGVVRVFDTLRGRNFRLAAPTPGCSFASIGGGFAVWNCAPPTGVRLTSLTTGRSREPAGIDQVEQMATPYTRCGPLDRYESPIGRYWLAFECVGWSSGSWSGPFYLNHRTGRLTEEIDPFSPGSPFIDLDYVGLFRPHCAPLKRAQLTDYARPLGLEAPSLGTGIRIDSIRLRRCGTKRAQILSHCRLTDCRTPQLGSRYVTWGEHKRAYAYLPRIRRRVLVGRAPADFLRGRSKLSVAHTCNRVFALWGYSVYAARFKPRAVIRTGRTSSQRDLLSVPLVSILALLCSGKQ
jgi:hypothetical protein